MRDPNGLPLRAASTWNDNPDPRVQDVLERRSVDMSSGYPSHVHRASCDDSIGMHVCGQQDEGELLVQQAYLNRPKLHPFQIITYITVIITCLAVLYGMLETYLFISDLQAFVAEVAERFNRDLGVTD